MSSRKWYAGIGSRRTLPKVLVKLQELGYQAAKAGWGLRSGAAPGADTVFEAGCLDAGGESQIFLPWKGFAGHTSTLTKTLPFAFELAKSVHPNWGALSSAARNLVSRNMHQITGPNLDDPVGCVLCWTPDGCESKEQYSIRTGGTGTAIALASSLGIPVFNIFNPNRYEEALEFLRAEE